MLLHHPEYAARVAGRLPELKRALQLAAPASAPDDKRAGGGAADGATTSGPAGATTNGPEANVPGGALLVDLLEYLSGGAVKNANTVLERYAETEQRETLAAIYQATAAPPDAAGELGDAIEKLIQEGARRAAKAAAGEKDADENLPADERQRRLIVRTQAAIDAEKKRRAAP